MEAVKGAATSTLAVGRGLTIGSASRLAQRRFWFLLRRDATVSVLILSQLAGRTATDLIFILSTQYISFSLAAFLYLFFDSAILLSTCVLGFHVENPT